MAILPFRRKVLLLKTESAYGTDPTPTGALNAILAMKGQITLEADKLVRELDLAYFGGKPFVLVGKRAKIEFEFESLGAAAPGVSSPWGATIKACGFAETLDPVGPPIEALYTPISDSIGSCAIYFWQNRQKFVILGCRGNMELMSDIKTFFKSKATFTGILAIPVDAAMPAVTLTAFQKPVAIETETFVVSLDGTALNSTGVTVNLNNDVQIHEGSESREIIINDSQPTGTIKCYDPGVAVKDLWALALSHAEVPLAYSVQPAASPAGRIISITAPKVQIELPKFAEINGAQGLDIAFTTMPDAGNDHLAISLQ